MTRNLAESPATTNGGLDCAPWRSKVCVEASPAWPETFTLGVLPGEGVGPDVVGVALDVLAAAAEISGRCFEIETGGPIGRDAEKQGGAPLSSGVIEHCRRVFARGGAILHGPGGGRFVYDLRQEFDLFCKLAPLRRWPELSGAGPLRDEVVANADVLVVRENCGGIYQGEFSLTTGADGERRAELHASYSEGQARRILRAGAGLAASRRRRMMVVVKDGAVPSLTSLWGDVARHEAAEAGVELDVLNVDYAAYRLVESPRELDVIVAPNMFGDVIADLGGLVVGARGLTYSGNFSAAGHAVYQTGHGAAYDLVGTDRANPLGQVMSLAMLLRESFGLCREARLIESAVRDTLARGVRTADLGPGSRIVGTRAMGRELVQAVRRVALLPA